MYVFMHRSLENLTSIKYEVVKVKVPEKIIVVDKKEINSKVSLGVSSYIEIEKELNKAGIKNYKERILKET